MLVFIASRGLKRKDEEFIIYCYLEFELELGYLNIIKNSLNDKTNTSCFGQLEYLR